MKKFSYVLAGAAAIGIAAPAFAQDTSTFTGPRVEALVGYDISKAGSSIDDDANENNDESSEGLLYGIGIGFDMPVARNAIAGIEAEYTDGNGDTDFDDADPNNFGLGNVETGRDLYVGARLGIMASSRSLVYVKGGYTNARYNVLGVNGTTELDENIDTDGWRIGAGAEMAMNENLFAKLEYRYSKYSEGEVDFEDDSFADTQRFEIDTDRHQLVAGVGWRF